MSRLAVLTTALALLATPTLANTITLTATGSGWCNDQNSCDNTNTSSYSNTYAGFTGGLQYRNWYAFALPSLGTINQVVLSAFFNASDIALTNPDTYTVYAANNISYNGLAFGPVGGSLDVRSSINGTNHFVDLALSADAVAGLNAAQGGTFIFGGATNPGGGQVSGYDSGENPDKLTITFDVPEPASLTLLGLGLLSVHLGRKRHQIGRSKLA